MDEQKIDNERKQDDKNRKRDEETAQEDEMNQNRSKRPKNNKQEKIESTTTSNSTQANDTNQSSLFKPIYITPKPIEDRKSKFKGIIFKVIDLEQVNRIIQFVKLNQHFYFGIGEQKPATHNLSAWRFFKLKANLNGLNGPNDFEIQSGFDDDGENWGGSKILKVMERNHIVDALMIVSRWYGGIMIGPKRFEHIETCTKESCERFKLVDQIEDLVNELIELDQEIIKLRGKLKGIKSKKEEEEIGKGDKEEDNSRKKEDEQDTKENAEKTAKEAEEHGQEIEDEKEKGERKEDKREKEEIKINKIDNDYENQNTIMMTKIYEDLKNQLDLNKCLNLIKSRKKSIGYLNQLILTQQQKPQ